MVALSLLATALLQFVLAFYSFAATVCAFSFAPKNWGFPKNQKFIIYNFFVFKWCVEIERDVAALAPLLIGAAVRDLVLAALRRRAPAAAGSFRRETCLLVSPAVQKSA